jgi:DNA-binding response OmpR family regulator
MRILIIEDDKKLANVLQKGLTGLTYAVDIACDGEEGEEMAKSISYDLIILDIILPGKDGIEVCLELRRSKINSRIIMLTSRDSVSDRVKGLNSGADDYLVKPFVFAELVARIRALFRREISDGSNVIRAGDLSIDTLTREVKRKDTSIVLTAKEYGLLEYFMRNPDLVLSRRTLEDHVWNFSLESASNLIDVYIRRLRKKLDPDNETGLIETVWGVGYRLKP